jgi:hypothetical protein
MIAEADMATVPVLGRFEKLENADFHKICAPPPATPATPKQSTGCLVAIALGVTVLLVALV